MLVPLSARRLVYLFLVVLLTLAFIADIARQGCRGLGSTPPRPTGAGHTVVLAVARCGSRHRTAEQRVPELGGTVLAAPFQVMEAGHMAIVQDPQGTVFALWQAGNHIGSAVVNMPGAITWNELATTDTAAAETFYHGLFGWTAKTEASPGGGGNYTVFHNGARTAAGMLAITPEMGGIVPNWAVYFGVTDLNATIEQVQAAGGSVLVPAMRHWRHTGSETPTGCGS